MAFLVYFGHQPGVLPWVIASALAGLSIFVFVEAFLARVEFDEDRLSVRSSIRRVKNIRWSEVVGYTYFEATAVYIIHTRSGERVRVPGFLDGIDDLKRHLEAFPKTDHT